MAFGRPVIWKLLLDMGYAALAEHPCYLQQAHTIKAQEGLTCT